MAWTYVRYDRESFGSAVKAKFPGGKLNTGIEFYFVIFVTIQLMQMAILSQGGQIDPVMAISQSLGLLAVAGLFAAKRAESTAKQSIPPATAATDANPVTPAAVTVPASTATSAIQIDEQSQTWADLMARISHEIRTPLNAVIGFSDLMEREIFGPLGNDRYRDYLAHIRDSGEALLRSAEDTLALSSMLAVSASGGRVQSSPLAALAKDAWVFVEPQASRRGISVVVNVPDVLDVAGDRRSYRQALSNLMLEAVSRATDGSRIEIKAIAHGDTVRIKVAAASTDHHVRPSQPSLAVCVARALLELQGTTLSAAACNATGRWQATTVLDLSVQPDFFG